jgi:glycosyltransferase involved in cell wall biosynthesis
MKVLLALHQYLPRHVTGTEQYVRSVAHELKAQGHQVTILCYEPLIQFEAAGQEWFERDEVVEGVPVRRFSVHPRHSANRELGDYENPIVGGMVGRFLRERRFDVAHVFHLRNMGLDVLRECRNLGTPVVVHLMDFWFLCPNFLLLRRDGSLCDGPPDGGFGCIRCIDPALAETVETVGLRPLLEPLGKQPPPASGLAPTPARRAHALLARKPALFAELERADAVIAPSKFLKGVFEAQGFPRGRIEVLPYGLDPTRGAARPAKPRDRADGLLHVGYIGSLSRHKGVHLAVAAVTGSARKDLVLHIFGDPESHPEYSAELRKLAAGDPRVVFEGRFGPTQLGEALAKLDCVVVPSLWHENTPFTALESLQFGLPVLASRLGGLSEIVRHGKNGLLFEAGDIVEIAASIERLADSPLILEQLSRNTETASVSRDVGRIVEVYSEILAAKAVR